MDVKRTAAILGLLAILAATPSMAIAGKNDGGLNMPSMDVFDYKSVIIHHDKGGTTTGSYDQTTGNFQLYGPNNKITIGQQDGQGNLTITEYGSDDDD
jgi:hypothetical protein